MKYLFFIFFSSVVLAQNSEIKDLINKINEEEIPKDWSYFNLVDSSFLITSNISPHFKEDLRDLILEFKIEDLKPNEFFENHDSILNFNNFEITRAKIYSRNNMPNYSFLIRKYLVVPYTISQDKLDNLNKQKKPNEIVVPVRKLWSKKKIQKVANQLWEESINSIKIEDRISYSFSTPLFNKNKNYAIVAIDRTNGGKYILLKKNKNNWTKITDFGFWAY